MLPPNVKSDFEDNETWIIALLVGYEQIRQLEEIPLEAPFTVKRK